jgi:HK97 family phage portal protein
MLSKLIHGNTYVLKERDNRGVVSSLYILDPTRVQVMVAPNSDIYYALQQDSLSGVEADRVVVPASEIIHDLMPPLFHPLVGVSPLTACYLPALQALRAQTNSSEFFQNGSVPGGILSYPGQLSQEQVEELRAGWEQNYSGANYGRVAVLAGDMKYQPIQMVSATDSQLVEQLKLSGENVCSAFGVPPFKVGIGPMPAYNNVEALNQLYYSDTLHIHVECIEALLDRGLKTGAGLGTEFDIDSLLRMDTATRSTAAKEALGGGMSPNEARQRFFDLGPVKGGESPYLQQQNFSLEALAKRDAKADPFGSEKAPEAPRPAPAAEDQPVTPERASLFLQKAMAAA